MKPAYFILMLLALCLQPAEAAKRKKPLPTSSTVAETILVVPVPASVASVVPATPIAAAREPAPFLWEVKKGNTTHYLSGSIHLLPKEAYPLPVGFEVAYQNSRTLVFEAHLQQLQQPASQLKVMKSARSQQPLSERLSPELLEKVRERLVLAKLKPDFCDAYQAWYCATMIEVSQYRNAGFSGESGLDMYLFMRASVEGKPVLALEGVEQHLALLTDMPDGIAQAFLAAELAGKSPDQISPELLYRAWRDNRAGELLKVLDELRNSTPLVYQHFLSDRNRQWLPRLQQYFDSPDSHFVVVGAAHLLGDDGLLALLRQAGYHVQPLSLTTLARHDSSQPHQPVPAPAATP